MIGKLVSKTVRTVYEKKVVRITVDVPYDRASHLDIGEEDMLRWLDQNVDGEIGFGITTLEDQDQEVIMEDHDKV